MAKLSLQSIDLPDVMKAQDGGIVASAGEWAVRREEILDMLAREEYGISPEPCGVHGVVETERLDHYAGKAIGRNCVIRLDTPGGMFVYPLSVVIPQRRPAALFVHISFYGSDASPYCPIEEIVDGGFAVATMDYNSVTRDSDDFSDGIAALFSREGDDAWGKIAMWAYAASRSIDYLATVEELEGVPIAVIGHSRLGKTALWCGANDERISFIISNDSGCSGSAISRGKDGESIADITRQFPYWFCQNYAKYANKENTLPFDQHFLLAACAPRKLYIGTAQQDIWADPNAEFNACLAVNPVYRLLGARGLIAPAMSPDDEARYHEGDIGYHLRAGTHFLSREDWRIAMDFIKKHL